MEEDNDRNPSNKNSLLTGTVPVNNSFLTGTVPANNSSLTGTVPVNNSLLTGTVPGNNILLTRILPVNNSLLTGTISQRKEVVLVNQYGKMSFLCMVHGNLCILHRFLYTVHTKFLPFFLQNVEFLFGTQNQICAHFKGSASEIVF